MNKVKYVRVAFVGDRDDIVIVNIVNTSTDSDGMYCILNTNGSTYKIPMSNIAFIYEAKEEYKP